MGRDFEAVFRAHYAEVVSFGACVGLDVAVADAAHVLGCAATTVRVHLWRARAALRAALGPDHVPADALPHEEVPR